MEELVMEVDVTMSVEFQSLTLVVLLDYVY